MIIKRYYKESKKPENGKRFLEPYTINCFYYLLCNKLLQNLLPGNNYFIAHDSVGQEFWAELRWATLLLSEASAEVTRASSWELGWGWNFQDNFIICTAYELRRLEWLRAAWASFPTQSLVGPLSLHGPSPEG